MDKDWSREHAEKYAEILKLDKKLTENGILHQLRPLYDGWIIEYYDPDGNKIGDAIEHRCSYGLEIDGFWRKDVEGNLTVDMAYEYFHYTHEKVKELVMRNKPGAKENPYICLYDYHLDGREAGDVVYCRNASLSAMKSANARGIELRGWEVMR